MDLQNTFNQISEKREANHLTKVIPQNLKLELVIFTKFRNLNKHRNFRGSLISTSNLENKVYLHVEGEKTLKSYIENVFKSSFTLYNIVIALALHPF